MRAWGRVGDGVVVLPHPAPGGVFRTPAADARLLPVAVSPHFRQLWSHKSSSNICWPKIGVKLENCQMRRFRVKALENYGENQAPIAPLKLESPAGLLLSQILQTHPHLFPAAIDQQLEQLESDKEVQKGKDSPTPQDALYRFTLSPVCGRVDMGFGRAGGNPKFDPRRIAEVKDKERQKGLKEIIYCLVVQKFMENDISMIPTIVPSPDPTMLVDSWPNQGQKLEAVHSGDALEMIENHISLVLGERSVGPLHSVAQMSKIKLGKLYAASIMYGYFLKRVDDRFQLERTMKTVPPGSEDRKTIFDKLRGSPLWDVESVVQIPFDEDDEFEGVDTSLSEDKSPRLRSYVMYLDAETLQRYATIRSKEAISLIEKQTQALFGRPDIRIADDGSIGVPNDEIISITFSGLTSLVLEAVAFGSFLWDAEGQMGIFGTNKLAQVITFHNHQCRRSCRPLAAGVATVGRAFSSSAAALTKSPSLARSAAYSHRGRGHDCIMAPQQPTPVLSAAATHLHGHNCSRPDHQRLAAAPAVSCEPSVVRTAVAS
ncbi:hypothetical protein Taro_025178, partial [Colocasia esculenta]|nr:hypothetical protein [Colocasia esculenta]